jgi:hypothetical protein
MVGVCRTGRQLRRLKNSPIKRSPRSAVVVLSEVLGT